ncbi:MAG: phospholipase D family protein [Desulfomicrobium sp.]|nr:phospholipase D family protein [Pseudomonadota bacterium]MBV1710383.1 phospholipase D family protein [Desulfomicrobium sp.]MBU4570004.1 phospholipase D family protein [Pseudomonadota bacterium]MBU4593922.1 phospholipase D family protein [Pseudomonadota bacterium]MBV1721055.1 phospholipase D family protein [Desulfomicrobium sp.]
MIDIKMVSNSGVTHFDELKKLFKTQSDKLIIISPFLANNIQELLSEFSFEESKEVELITTFKPSDPEQITKPKVLKFFFEYFKHTYPNIKIKIHINNKLHGKIYIAINGIKRSMIVGSANFTRNGLFNNHEYSLKIHDNTVIDSIIKETFNSIEYQEVTYHQICKACQFAESYEKDHPEWTQGPKIHCNILDVIYSVENKKNTSPQYFLKPIGHSKSPILLSDQCDFSALHQNLHFSKKKPKGVMKGDIIITTAVGAGSILSYYIVTGGIYHVSKTDIENDPFLERWPWYVEARNMSVEFGKEWWKHDIKRQEILNEYLKKFKDVPVTNAGGFTLGTINRGNDKVKITEEFGKFIISRINGCKDFKHPNG